jgi:hypothetical protein
MLRSPVLALLGFAILLAALDVACDASKCCEVPPPSGTCDSSRFTACVHSCGETTSSEPTAAACANGVYSCSNSTFPAVSCPTNGWSASLPCGPWVDGYDCGAQCAVCDQGLWTCGACGDAAVD